MSGPRRIQIEQDGQVLVCYCPGCGQGWEVPVKKDESPGVQRIGIAKQHQHERPFCERY